MQDGKHDGQMLSAPVRAAYWTSGMAERHAVGHTAEVRANAGGYKRARVGPQVTLDDQYLYSHSAAPFLTYTIYDAPAIGCAHWAYTGPSVGLR